MAAGDNTSSEWGKELRGSSTLKYGPLSLDARAIVGLTSLSSNPIDLYSGGAENSIWSFGPARDYIDPLGGWGGQEVFGNTRMSAEWQGNYHEGHGQMPLTHAAMDRQSNVVSSVLEERAQYATQGLVSSLYAERDAQRKGQSDMSSEDAPQLQQVALALQPVGPISGTDLYMIGNNYNFTAVNEWGSSIPFVSGVPLGVSSGGGALPTLPQFTTAAAPQILFPLSDLRGMMSGGSNLLAEKVVDLHSPTTDAIVPFVPGQGESQIQALAGGFSLPLQGSGIRALAFFVQGQGALPTLLIHAQGSSTLSLSPTAILMWHSAAQQILSIYEAQAVSSRMLEGSALNTAERLSKMDDRKLYTLAESVYIQVRGILLGQTHISLYSPELLSATLVLNELAKRKNLPPHQQLAVNEASANFLRCQMPSAATAIVPTQLDTRPFIAILEKLQADMLAPGDRLDNTDGAIQALDAGGPMGGSPLFIAASSAHQPHPELLAGTPRRSFQPYSSGYQPEIIRRDLLSGPARLTLPLSWASPSDSMHLASYTVVANAIAIALARTTQGEHMGEPPDGANHSRGDSGGAGAGVWRYHSPTAAYAGVQREAVVNTAEHRAAGNSEESGEGVFEEMPLYDATDADPRITTLRMERPPYVSPEDYKQHAEEVKRIIEGDRSLVRQMSDYSADALISVLSPEQYGRRMSAVESTLRSERSISSYNAELTSMYTMKVQEFMTAWYLGETFGDLETELGRLCDAYQKAVSTKEWPQDWGVCPVEKDDKGTWRDYAKPAFATVCALGAGLILSARSQGDGRLGSGLEGGRNALSASVKALWGCGVALHASVNTRFENVGDRLANALLGVQGPLPQNPSPSTTSSPRPVPFGRGPAQAKPGGLGSKTRQNGTGWFSGKNRNPDGGGGSRGPGRGFGL